MLEEDDSSAARSSAEQVKLKGHCHEIFVKREKPKDMF